MSHLESAPAPHETPMKIQEMAKAATNDTVKAQLENIGAEATRLFDRLVAMQSSGEKWENMQPILKKMSNLYNQACDINARQIGETTFQHQIEEAFPDGNTYDTHIRNGLIDIAHKADMDPANITSATPQSERGYFLPTTISGTREEGPLQVNTRAVNEAIAEVETQLRKNVSLHPKQQQVLLNLRERLLALIQTNKMAAFDNALGKAINRQGTNYEPLRILGAISGTLLTAVGINVFLKTGKLPWPTVLWGLIAAVSVKPDLLKSGAFQSVQKFQILAEEDTQKFLLNNRIQGAQDARGIEELFGGNNLTALKKLADTQQPLDQQTLTDAGVSGQGLNLLMKLPDRTERATCIEILSRIHDKEVQKKLIQYVRER